MDLTVLFFIINKEGTKHAGFCMQSKCRLYKMVYLCRDWGLNSLSSPVKPNLFNSETLVDSLSQILFLCDVGYLRKQPSECLLRSLMLHGPYRKAIFIRAEKFTICCRIRNPLLVSMLNIHNTVFSHFLLSFSWPDEHVQRLRPADRGVAG